MTYHMFQSASDPLITSAVAGSDSRERINRLWVSTKAAREHVNVSLASIQSSLLLVAEIERSISFRPIPLRLPEEGPVVGMEAL
jgi:hypothetical protein